jgi:hypothetical protein
VGQAYKIGHIRSLAMHRCLAGSCPHPEVE